MEKNLVVAVQQEKNKKQEIAAVICFDSNYKCRVGLHKITKAFGASESFFFYAKEKQIKVLVKEDFVAQKEEEFEIFCSSLSEFCHEEKFKLLENKQRRFVEENERGGQQQKYSSNQQTNTGSEDYKSNKSSNYYNKYEGKKEEEKLKKEEEEEGEEEEEEAIELIFEASLNKKFVTFEQFLEFIAESLGESMAVAVIKEVELFEACNRLFNAALKAEIVDMLSLSSFENNNNNSSNSSGNSNEYHQVIIQQQEQEEKHYYCDTNEENKMGSIYNKNKRNSFETTRAISIQQPTRISKLEEKFDTLINNNKEEEEVEIGVGNTSSSSIINNNNKYPLLITNKIKEEEEEEQSPRSYKSLIKKLP